ncbi:hypothetical protein ScPMuIL_001989 [Solemya velum]
MVRYRDQIPWSDTMVRYRGQIDTVVRYLGQIPWPDTMVRYRGQTPWSDTVARYRGQIPRSDTAVRYHGCLVTRPDLRTGGGDGDAGLSANTGILDFRGVVDPFAVLLVSTTMGFSRPTVSSAMESMTLDVSGPVSDLALEVQCVSKWKNPWILMPLSKGGNECTLEKSIKVNLKHVASSAATKLKSLKNKRRIHANTSKVGLKRKMDDTTQLDATTEIQRTSEKERKKMRKMMKTNHETIQRSKKIWETCEGNKLHDVADSKKHEMCSELLTMVKGNMKQYVFAHDTARVLQCLIQHGSLDQKDQVFDEIKDEICSLIKSTYGKFLVKKLLKYGTKQHRNLIFKG